MHDHAVKLDRERGASRVPMLAFLATLVLFIGSAFLAYLQWKEKKNALTIRDRAIAERVAAQTDDEIVRHYVEDLAKALGEVGTYKGRDGWSYDVNGRKVRSTDPDIADIQIDNAVLPTRVREAMDGFADRAGVPSRADLSGLFAAVLQRIDQVKSEADTANSHEASLNTEIKNLRDAVQTVTNNAQRSERDLNAQLRQKDDDYVSDLAEKDQRIQAANAQVARISEQMADQAANHERVVAGLRKEIETLQARIEAAANKTRLVNPKQAPDGMVLEASEAAGLAWINLGRRDMLPVGTPFEIVSQSTGTVKGSGVVTRLEQTRAMLRVTSVKDRFDPIQPGDQVRNDLYSPEMSHNIYLLGRFGAPFPRPLLKTLLEELGNHVVDELSPSVDLVLVGSDIINEDGSGFTNIEETAEYKRAEFLRIEMAPLSRVRQFLKLGDEPASSTVSR
ncbi:MAG: hypothetical protein IPM29_02670 [Planctomycetes bacterium]|nr:hypothetical protein [Planctomycetota bacterium]